MLRRTAAVLVLCLGLAGAYRHVAAAPDAGVAVAAPPAVHDPLSIHNLADTLLRFASDKNYAGLFALAVILFVWLVRRGVLHEKLLGRYRWLVWLRGDVWGWVIAVATGIAGGALTALMAGKPITGALVLSGAVNGALASGIFVGVDKAVKAARTTKKATPLTPPRQDDAGYADALLVVGVAVAGLMFFAIVVLVTGGMQ